MKKRTKQAKRNGKTALSNPTPLEAAVVIFGLDEKGLPRAARFSAADADLATRAAALMGVFVLPVADDPIREVAAKLRAGDPYASARTFAPIVRKDLYARLSELAGDKAPAAPDPIHIPRTWDEVALGSLVLANEGGVDNGWWEAVVIGLDGDQLRLRWRWEPAEPSLARTRDQLALPAPESK